MRHAGQEESSEQHVLILWAREYCALMRLRRFANPVYVPISLIEFSRLSDRTVIDLLFWYPTLEVSLR
jgi:hypothetical protein